MIYVEPRAGLSNRMRVIASACHLAEKYNTKVVVLWKVSKDLNASFYKLFKPIRNVEIKESKYRLSVSFVWDAVRARGYYKNISWGVDGLEADLKSGKNIYIRTVHQFSEVEDYNIFRPTDSIEEGAQYLTSRITDHTVGVHIRRTDNLSSIERSPIELFIEKMDDIVREDYMASFYVATDSEEVISYIRNRYKEKIIYAENIKLERNSLEGMEGALIDLLCLSKCRMILGSYYSSFSEAAAFWGKKELYVLDIENKK